MSTKHLLAGAAAATLIVAGAGGLWAWRHAAAPVPATAVAADARAAAPLLDPCRGILADYRKIIVLLAHESTLSEEDRRRAVTVGQAIFHEKLAKEARLGDALDALATGRAEDRLATLSALLDYVESGDGLYDADRLAFREILVRLQQAVAKDGSLPAIKLHQRIGEDLDALGEIEHTYDKEISRIFSHFEARAIVQKREKWEDYAASATSSAAGAWKRSA